MADEPTAREIMNELQYIRGDIAGNKKHLETIQHELAGNGGPGMRTRIHALEVGFGHLRQKMKVIEEENERQHKEQQDFLHELDNRIQAIRNTGAGLLLGLLILEALRWIVPLLQSP